MYKKHAEQQIDLTRRENSPWYIIIETLKVQKKIIVKATRAKDHKGRHMRTTPDVSVETLKA